MLRQCLSQINIVVRRISVTFTENLPTIFRKFIFQEASPKSFPQGVLLIFKFSENCPKTHREFSEKLSLTSFIKSIFPEFYNVPKFSENFETILANVLFQFC